MPATAPAAWPPRAAWVGAEDKLSIYLNLYPVTREIPARFLNALMTKCGRDAAVGIPVPKDKAAMKLAPFLNLLRISDGVMLNISGVRIVPLSNTYFISIPYVNGLSPSFCKRAAWPAPTFFPLKQT